MRKLEPEEVVIVAEILKQSSLALIEAATNIQLISTDLEQLYKDLPARIKAVQTIAKTMNEVTGYDI